LGAGKKQPQLHEPTYDFPDELIATGVSIFLETINEIHN
jgi:metal-dependent amidase/aminoacylase/carboxypeptidase family protein